MRSSLALRALGGTASPRQAGPGGEALRVRSHAAVSPPAPAGVGPQSRMSGRLSGPKAAHPAPSRHGARQGPSHPRHKLKAFGRAKSLCVQMRALAGLVVPSWLSCIRDDGGQGARLHPRSHSQVKGCWSVDAPTANPDISGSAAATPPHPVLGASIGIRAWRQEARLFNLGVQAGGLSATGQQRTKAIVALDPIASAGTHQCMVAEPVHDPIAERARDVLISDGEAQAPADHDPEKRCLDMQTKSLARRRLQPGASMRLALQLEVRPKRLTALPSRAQPQRSHAVQRPRQQLLSEGRRHRKRNVICGRDLLVEVGDGRVVGALVIILIETLVECCSLLQWPEPTFALLVVLIVEMLLESLSLTARKHAWELPSEWRPDAMHADSSLVYNLALPRFVSSTAFTRESSISGTPTHLVPLSTLLHKQTSNWALRLLGNGKPVFVQMLRNKTDSLLCSVLCRELRNQQHGVDLQQMLKHYSDQMPEAERKDIYTLEYRMQLITKIALDPRQFFEVSQTRRHPTADASTCPKA